MKNKGGGKMNMPGFTAEVLLSQTNNHYRLAAGGSFPRDGKTTVTRRALLDAKSAVVPAQIDWERVSRFLSSRGGVRRLWDPPACPLGQKAVWVTRGPTEKCCDVEVRVWDNDLRRYIWETQPRCGWQWCGWNPGFTGWECQSAFRVVA
jgi:hypothetical protein